MKDQKLSTQPYKGTKDYLPQDFEALKYIQDTWRKVCLQFGYEEYITPLLESAEIYRAKSGELKEELFVLRDRADRELAIRPEMTPSVTRMVAGMYKEAPKPLRLFSIASFYRNEAPQKGRTREFWQLNADIFGEESISADLEILSMAVEIMLAFGAPKESFKLYFSNRLLIEDLFNKVLKIDASSKEAITRAMDKYDKFGAKEVEKMLDKASLSEEQIQQVLTFLTADIITIAQKLPELENSQGLNQTLYILQAAKELNYSDYIQFNPSIVRGFDYYNGLIFEVFDMNPDNNRSLFGGGRYNGLSEIFGVENFPATGFAPGNVTLELFLKNWNLIPTNDFSTFYYAPLLQKTKYVEILNIVNKLRRANVNVELDTDEKNVSQALRYANKRGYKNVVLIGEEELSTNTLTVKNMVSGEQETKALENFLSDISLY